MKLQRSSVVALLAATLTAVSTAGVAATTPNLRLQLASPADERAAPDEQFMQRQQRAARLLERLERIPRQGYVSLRLARDGTVVVKNKRNTSRENIRREAEAAGVDRLEFEDVPYSLDDLEELLPRVQAAADASDFFNQGINATIGKISVHGPGALEPSSELGRLNEEYPELLAVREYVEVRTQSRACQAPHCDPPLRGGVRITSNANCTAGFNVLSNVDNKPYVLTAGHCIRDLGPPGALWYTRNSLYHQQFIGAAWRYNYGPSDGGIIKFDPTYYYPGQAYAGVLDWTWVTNRPVTNVSGSAAGFYFCLSGGVIAQNGSPCDYVDSVGRSFTYDDGVAVTNMGVWGYQTTDSAYCPRTAGGDSGGPFWDIYSTGYGILSAETYTIDSRTGRYLDCALVYQSLALALERFNVRLRTSTGY